MNLHFSRFRMLAGAGATLALTARRAGAQTLLPVRLVGVPTDDLTPVVYAVQNGMYRKAGLDVELVPGTTGDASTLAVVAADSPIRTAPDLDGKTGSSTALRDIVTLSISAWCDQNGGDSRTPRWTEIPNSAKAAALIDHRIDFCSLNEPQLPEALSGGKLRTMKKIARARSATTGDPAQIQPVVDLAVKYQLLPHGFPAKEAYASA